MAVSVASYLYKSREFASEEEMVRYFLDDYRCVEDFAAQSLSAWQRVRLYTWQLAAMVAVLFVGPEINGARRWLKLAGLTLIRAGTLDDSAGIVPQFEIFTKRRPAWDHDISGIPQFAEMPPG